MCQRRQADCPADGTNLRQGAGAWAGARGLVPGGCPSQGTSAARGGVSGVLWVPFVDAKHNVKYWCQHVSGTGLAQEYLPDSRVG